MYHSDDKMTLSVDTMNGSDDTHSNDFGTFIENNRLISPNDCVLGEGF